MPSDLPFDRQCAALGELWRLIEERRTGEEELAASAAREHEGTAEEVKTAREALAQTQENELAELDAAFQQEQEELTTSQEEAEAAARQKLIDGRHRLESRVKKEREKVDGALNEALLVADSLAEDGEKKSRKQVETVRRDVAAGLEKIDGLWEQIEPLLARVELTREDVEADEKE